ncbi:chromate transporter [Viridibacillus arvi]|uniref:Transporter n=1 Tax=Viridibacillus arvi TaxID=263475 RepID=A0A0M0LGD4_9BACL|nr:chromate transporter [Viridibacillus arvi]KOO50016.1 transporter [Viridibacillus arvi]
MIYWHIFMAFFIPGILGYGGGPSSIPLVQQEVVEHYGWMTNQEFSEMVAAGNALPGPIATKMAGFVGYDQAGILGIIVAVFATVAPSLILMIALLSVLMKYKESPYVKNLTKYIRPIIAVLLLVMTFDFAKDAWLSIGWISTLIIMIGAYLLLEKFKIHPAFVICIALIYGMVSTLF